MSESIHLLNSNTNNHCPLEYGAPKCCCAYCAGLVQDDSTGLVGHPDLIDKRYLNTKLIYVIGLPFKATKYDLKSERFFGRFGPVENVTVSRQVHRNHKGRKSWAAHILYVNPKDALLCLFCTNLSTFHNIQMSASIGTTQYCAYFLRGIPCQNAVCSFQHSEGYRLFQFSPDEMNKRNPLFTTLTRPSPPLTLTFEGCDFADDFIPPQPDLPEDLLLERSTHVRSRIEARVSHNEPPSIDPVDAYFKWRNEREEQRRLEKEAEEKAAWERLYAEMSPPPPPTPTPPKRSLDDHGIKVEFPPGYHRRTRQPQ